jgi:hypothetical protein
MPVPWEGDSSDRNIPGITGKNTTASGGVGVPDKKAGVFGESNQGTGVVWGKPRFRGRPGKEPLSKCRRQGNK